MFSDFRGLFPLGLLIAAATAWGFDSTAAAAASPTDLPPTSIVHLRIEPPSIASRPTDRPFDYQPFLGHDVRAPRKPRQRSDRPVKQTVESDSTTTATLSVIDLDLSCRRFLFASRVPLTRAGHPAELLRPPSRLA